MNFEPQKFFIGLMDFFSILLPGALLTYLLMNDVGPVFLGCYRYRNLSGAEGGAAFLLASYLFGHLIFLVGSCLDELYDWLRGFTLNKQIALLAKRGKLMPWGIRTMVRLVFKQERDLAVDRAGQIKRQALDPLQAGTAINTFQWSKTLLTLESPACLATVQRFEADSKFFRCLVIVLFILVGRWVYQGAYLLAGFGAAMILMALWRYLDQRFKATNQAYWSVIAFTAKDKKITLEKSASEPGVPTRVGGVVFRMRAGQTEFLLVEAKDDPEQRVLPKGHVEDKESLRETAVREVCEETGVWGKIREDLGPVSYTVNGTVITVQFYLMEYAGRGPQQDINRWHDWLPINKAIVRANHLETRGLLQSAAKRLEQLRKKQRPQQYYVVGFIKRTMRILKLIFKGPVPR